MVTNSKNWVVDSGATKHICASRDAFTSYTPVGDDENVVYLGDSHIAQVLGKGKVIEGTQPEFPLPNPRDSPDTPTDLRKHFF